MTTTLLLSCQTPSKTETDKQTNGQTDRHQVSNFVHFNLKNVTSGGNDFYYFLDNQLTKFRAFIWLIPVFIPRLPYIFMNHRASSTHRMDAPDRHNEQTDRQTDRETNG